MRLGLIITMMIGLLSTSALAVQHTRKLLASAAPPVAALDLWHLFNDDQHIAVTVGGHGAAAPWETTVSAVSGSPALWRRMHLADWNAVPADLRARGLETMLARHHDLLVSPAAWARMTADAWDFIPQPIRVVAFRQMTRYWARFYAVGERHGLPYELVADTLVAVVMSESWFNHRAGVTYENGHADLGLAQASAFARGRLRQLYERGRVDVAWDDSAYSNPWHATRFVALWMSLMLDEADGDIDLAVRAYNRGLGRARDALGTEYLAIVQQRLTRYVHNVDTPAAWDLVWRHAQALDAELKAVVTE